MKRILDNEYYRKYMKARYDRARKEVNERLGGACVRCGSEKDLQMDHVDPTTRTMGLNRMAVVSRERFEEELAKCQLLCQRCHVEKTVVEDLGRKLAKGTHGTLSAYRYCHCEECRAAKSAYQRTRKGGEDGESRSSAK